MPSSFSHAAAGLALGSAFRPTVAPVRFWLLVGLCAVLPDIDWLGRPFGIPYDHLLGHRGVTHSVCFAALLGAAVTWTAFRTPEFAGVRGRLWVCFTLATVSHGVLDALTTYGQGVAFAAPFTTERFSFPWHPIGAIGPHTPRRFVDQQIVAVVLNELLWIWLPSALFAGAVLVRHRRHGSASAAA